MTFKKASTLILKRIEQVLLTIIVLIYVVVAVLNTTIGQSFTAAIVADYFSKQWKTTIHIGALSVTPFINAGIKDIYVQDLSKDTLLYASYIEANLGNIPKGKHIVVSDVLLQDVVCHITEKNDKFNFQFIIDYFKSNKPKKEKPKSEPLVLEVKDLQLKNVDFALINYDKNYPIIKGMFATNDIECNDVNMHVKNFYMKGTDMRADILHLQTKERCGIELKEFKGKTIFGRSGIKLTDAEIATNDTRLYLDATLKTKDFHTYSSFIDSVYCTLQLHKGSFADLKDACYWSEKIRNANQKVYLTCDIEGTVADMNIKAFDMRTENIYVNADGTITGLTDVNHTFFDLNINDVVASFSDYQNMKLGTLIENVTLPDMISKLGTVNILGDFRGFLNNFNTTLNIVSDLGDLTVQAKAKPEINNLTRYTFETISSNLDLATLTDNKLLKGATFHANGELLGTDTKNMQGNLDAKLQNFYFNGNSYDDVSLQGDINGYDINAQIGIVDDNVNFDGICFINYENKPTIRLDADIAKLNLHKLNFVDFADTNTIIAAKINGGVYDFDINKLNADVLLDDVKIKTSSKEFDLNNISLIASNVDSNNTIVLSSDIIDADFNGKYSFASLGNDIEYIVSKYVPDFSAITSLENVRKETKLYNKNYTIQSDLDFTAHLKDVSLLKILFGLDVEFPQQVDIKGAIGTDTAFVCDINAIDVRYTSMKIKNADIDLHTESNALNLGVNVGQFNVNDSLGFKDIAISSVLDSTNIGLILNMTKSDDSTTDANIEFNSTIDANGLMGSFSNTFFDIEGTRIDLNNNHMISVKNMQVGIMNFVVSSAASSITIDGVVSNQDELKCTFDNVDLSLFNPFLASMGMTLSGTLNKEVLLKNVLQSPTFTSNLEANDLTINDVYLGKAWLNLDNNVSPDVFNTNIKFLYQAENKDVVPLQVVGTVAPSAEKNQLDLNVSMQNFQLAIIKTFIANFVSDVEGSISCNNLTIKGKMTSPDIQGKLHCNHAGMKVNMLNTKYWIDDDIFVDNNKFKFKDFKLKDVLNNQIVVNGNITHYNFSSFDIKLNAVADKIKILDTKAGNGEMYYGTAYASANIDLVGDSTMINISGSAKTEPGTSLTVPVTSKESAEENEFITFNSINDTSKEGRGDSKNEEQTTGLGYNIDIDLNVNPNAKLFIPMDFTQLKGDLTAAGNGDLKIAMNSDGKFSMIGEVAIDNGNFGINIMDVMEKNFVLERGGTLTWSGEPTGGIMDITAKYKTKASLSTILGDKYSKPVDVESIIHLTGVMTNPQPTFDINLPNTDEETVEQLFMNIDRSSEKVMLEQTASLLLTNQFYYSQGGYQTDALQSGVTSSVMGVAFSQLSGMITNMIKFVDVSLTYSSTGMNSNSSDQIGANFSKSYGKWEASVNTSFGGNSYTNTTSEGSQIIGDVSLKYKYTNNLQFEVFNHSNANDFTKFNVSPYTQGAKMSYKKEYESIKDIFRRKTKKKIAKNTEMDKKK